MCLSPVAKRSKKTKGRRIIASDLKTRKAVYEETELKGRHDKLILAPCGYCSECEAKKRSEWAFRLHWESLDHKFGWFCMLTYNAESAPWINPYTGEFKRGSEMDMHDLTEFQMFPYKRDIQTFIKRLRRRQEYYHKKGLCENPEIRYFIVSEYGENATERPHFHAVIFGMTPFIRQQLLLYKIWKNGFVTARPLDVSKGQRGFMYLTKYLYKQKKLKKHFVPPYSLMSKKPYIGNRFERYCKEYMLKNNTYELPSVNGSNYIPTIYRDKLPAIKKEIAKQKLIKKTDANEEKQYLENPNYYLDQNQKKFAKQRRHNRELQKIKNA
jgi:hypothetical protein